MASDEKAFETQLREFSDYLNELSQDRLATLKSASGTLGKILTGHLIAEELLGICLEVRSTNPEYIEKANLRFFQKLQLVRAHQGIPEITEDFWPLLLKLNALRNHLAHDLQQGKLDALAKELIALVEKSQDRSAALAEKFGVDEPVYIDAKADDALFQALHYILGGLHAITVWTHHLEALVAHKMRG